MTNDIVDVKVDVVDTVGVIAKGGEVMDKVKWTDKVKNGASKVGRQINKHSPAILTTAGIVGLGATAYLAYKSKDKVEEVVVKMEEDRAQGLEPNRFEVAKDLSQALALPISVGVMSSSFIFIAHQIQNNRIKALAGVVATSAAENFYYRSKYRDKYGDEEYNEFYTPMSEEEVTVTGEDGEEEVKTANVRDDISSGLNGMWFDQSSEYAVDDNGYNKSYIASIINKLELIYFQRGFLLLNEALQEMGFETTRQGAILGWTMSKGGPDFEVIQHKIFNPDTGFEEPQLYIRWSQPTSEYDNFDYSEGLDKWR